MNIDHAKRVLEYQIRQQEKQSMLISSAFPGRYIKAEDLAGESMTVTIRGFAMEQVAKSGDPQPVVYFKEFDRGMVLNKTNAKSIARMHGDETNRWKGKQICLFEAMIEFQGNVGPALRIREPGQFNAAPQSSAWSPSQDTVQAPAWDPPSPNPLNAQQQDRPWEPQVNPQFADKPTVSEEALSKIKKPKKEEPPA